MTTEGTEPRIEWERASDHGWRYFELHAGQRMTMFNYYIVAVGLVSAGIGAVARGPTSMAPLGLGLGLTLMLLSLLFWKLDQRSAFLVKHAEGALIEAERRCLPEPTRLFVNEGPATDADPRSRLARPWTYGASFRTAFAVIALAGAATSTVSAVHLWPQGSPASGAKSPDKSRDAVPTAPGQRRVAGGNTETPDPGRQARRP